jgi:hypothetical protein
LGLPEVVVDVLRRPVEVGHQAQAFPFLTVDAEGLPHVALLSGRELAVTGDGALVAALMSPTTCGNLRRSGAATILIVEGDTAHSVKLRLRTIVEGDGALVGCVFDFMSHKADSLGIPLVPMSFTPTGDVARIERWETTARMLRAISR